MYSIGSVAGARSAPWMLRCRSRCRRLWCAGRRTLLELPGVDGVRGLEERRALRLELLRVGVLDVGGVLGELGGLARVHRGAVPVDLRRGPVAARIALRRHLAVRVLDAHRARPDVAGAALLVLLDALRREVVPRDDDAVERLALLDLEAVSHFAGRGTTEELDPQ